MWVAEGRHLAVLDAAGGSVLSRLQLPAAPSGDTCYGVRYTNGELLAIRSDGTIGPIDPKSSSYTPIGKVATISTNGFGSANWAAGFGSYWVGSFSVNTKTAEQVNVLERLDPSSGQVRSEPAIASGANAIVADPASGLWALGESSGLGVLVHVDPASGQPTRRIPLSHFPCCPSGAVGMALAVGHGRLWVGLDSP